MAVGGVGWVGVGVGVRLCVCVCGALLWVLRGELCTAWEHHACKQCCMQIEQTRYTTMHADRAQQPCMQTEQTHQTEHFLHGYCLASPCCVV